MCCLAGEAKNPKVNLPLAVFGTIGVTTLLYVLASLALVGMVPYQDINSTDGFSDAFGTRGWPWAQQV